MAHRTLYAIKELTPRNYYTISHGTSLGEFKRTDMSSPHFHVILHSTNCDVGLKSLQPPSLSAPLQPGPSPYYLLTIGIVENGARALSEWDV